MSPPDPTLSEKNICPAASAQTLPLANLLKSGMI